MNTKAIKQLTEMSPNQLIVAVFNRTGEDNPLVKDSFICRVGRLLKALENEVVVDEVYRNENRVESISKVKKIRNLVYASNSTQYSCEKSTRPFLVLTDQKQKLLYVNGYFATCEYPKI